MRALKACNTDWFLHIDFLAVKRVRAMVKRANGEGFDLLQTVVFEETEIKCDLLQELASDPLLLLEVIYAILKPQADEKGIPEQEFFSQWTSDDIELASDLFIRELIDFFPEAKSRLLRKINDAVTRERTKSIPVLKKLLNDPELEKKIENSVRGTLRIDVPESSE